MAGFPLLLPSAMAKLVAAGLNNLLKEEILLVWKVDDKFNDLQATSMEIEAMLGKLDRWETTNPTLELWLQDLERYCYDMEDLIDHLLLCLSAKEEVKKPGKKPVRQHILKSGMVTIPHKIDELLKESQAIKIRIQSLFPAGVITSGQPQDSRKPSLPRNGGILSDNRPLVPVTSWGRDKQAIINGLTSMQLHPSGVSIVGMDGLGKTSLARTILVDELVRSHFSLILSATVSSDFHMEDVAQKLAADYSRSLPNDPHLQSLVYGHRSLIVLDDLWSVTDEDWDYFKHNYLNPSKGSKILTTTRNPKVAEVTHSTAHYLHGMGKGDCKELIITKANLSESDREWACDDIEIIAEKCNGMPIIANKIGLKLSQKRGDELKDTIAQFKIHELWELQEFREVLPRLNLNEPILPPDLKRCFAYCSLFPPDHIFNRDVLTHLWEVEGFVQPRQTRSSKQVINQPFDDLLSRSVFQPSETGDNKLRFYKMHKFNHDFAGLLASKAFCRVDEGTPFLLSSCRSIRHLSLNPHNTDKALLKKIEQCKDLRTFHLLHQSKPKTCAIPHNFYAKLERLRLLDLSYYDIKDLPKSSLSEHLRYLDLSNTTISKLPNYICSLCALKVLKLKDCIELKKLPKNFKQLISLTHLYVTKELGSMSSNMGQLERLEVLDCFVVGEGKGQSVLELREMQHLREVRIIELEKISSWNEAEEAKLSDKPWLRTLTLEWGHYEQVTNAGAILDALLPHNHLKDLSLVNYSGQIFPEWLHSPSCLLVSISVDGCNGVQMLPSVGQLPLLKNLKLRNIHQVENLSSLFYRNSERPVFRCLELLEFQCMEKLVSWGTELKEGDMPCLGALKLSSCQLLVNLPSLEHLSCLINLEIDNCERLPSVPKLPSSMNGEFGELAVTNCELIAKRCHVGGDDWMKIKDIPKRNILPHVHVQDEE